MKIQLSNIKPSPKPIRSTWDETKMEELKWSLMEEGQVEPVGLDTENTIVFGHRRVEAARRAGWTEIEAVIIPKNEINNLIQAGIENLSGEDMSADDKAEWASRLIELGLSQHEISRRSSVPRNTISSWITYHQNKDMAKLVSRDQLKATDDGIYKVRELVYALGTDNEAKKAVAEKVSRDKLTGEQTREVAQAYRDAPTPELKQQVLKTPIISRDTAADILRRSTNRARMEGSLESSNEVHEWQREREEKRTYQDFDFAVKEFLDSARLFLEVANKGSALVKYGKYSPEAARFTIRKIDALIDALKTYKEELENVK